MRCVACNKEELQKTMEETDQDELCLDCFYAVTESLQETTDENKDMF
jgi:hypothetical protein